MSANLLQAKTVPLDGPVIGIPSVKLVAREREMSVQQGLSVALVSPVMKPVAIATPDTLEKDLPHVAANSTSHAIWKRAMDIVLGSLFLLMTLPIWLVVCALVKLTSEGPVFYKSKRVGLSGQEFYMYKFRSMYIDADARLGALINHSDQQSPIFKIKCDPRVTPIGRFLRRYSLDELPQFLNVLIGDMSLVGPRALHKFELLKFDARGIQRLAVKPGVTCYWQIMGRSDLNYEKSVELDHRYMREAGPLTDLKILCMTPKAVLAGEGAY